MDDAQNREVVRWHLSFRSCAVPRPRATITFDDTNTRAAAASEKSPRRERPWFIYTSKTFALDIYRLRAHARSER